MDRIDQALVDAGRLREESVEEREALRALISARSGEVGQRRRRRKFRPALGVAGAFVVLGAGAAVATQWAPWNYVLDPDIVIMREWTDATGNSLGACETRWSTDPLAPEVRDAARQYLDQIDIDTIDPAPEVVASLLVAVGRPDSMSRLLPGEDIAEYDVHHNGPLWDADWWSDARILQDGLNHKVFTGLSDHLITKWPELDTGNSGVASRLETQCTTDPKPAGQP